MNKPANRGRRHFRHDTVRVTRSATHPQPDVVVVGHAVGDQRAAALAAAPLIVDAGLGLLGNVQVRPRGAHPHRLAVVRGVPGVGQLGIDGAPVVELRLHTQLALRRPARKLLDEVCQRLVLVADDAAEADAVALAGRAGAIVGSALATGVEIKGVARVARPLRQAQAAVARVKAGKGGLGVL